ncbi:MAG: acetoin utilization protein AcuC [Planctomycetota bacterium]|nr:acetoin utilization protein AcuC [Planctomycetota bacterium]
MNPTKAVFIHSAEIEKYHYPPDCPFSSERAGKARRILASMGLLTGEGRREIAPEAAGRLTLESFHTPAYLDVLQKASKGDLDIEGLRMGLGTHECPVFIGLYEYAALASGGTLTGAKMILSGDVDVAFNPSGGYHHAHPAEASGFCYINDVVLACMHLAAGGMRVLFIDVDVHHCDGVQEAFYNRSDVMTLSLHESGKTLFPGTGFEDEIGVGDGKGYSVNVPLPVDTYDEAFIKAFRAVALPLIGAYDPDVIVLELGMDCLSGDPLAHLKLTNNAYAEVVQSVLDFGKPILAVGGGGYHIENTARGWALAWSILSGQNLAADEMSIGMGGVLLESTDWHGGLRDRMLVVDARKRRAVDPEVNATIEKVKSNVFSLHGLSS